MGRASTITHCAKKKNIGIDKLSPLKLRHVHSGPKKSTWTELASQNIGRDIISQTKQRHGQSKPWKTWT